MEVLALSGGSSLCTTYTPESATVTALRVRAPLRAFTDALPMWPGKTACWEPDHARMGDPPTSQLPLFRATGGDRESVRLSPTMAGLIEGEISTVPEARIAVEKNKACYLLRYRRCDINNINYYVYSFFSLYLVSETAKWNPFLRCSSPSCISRLRWSDNLSYILSHTPSPLPINTFSRNPTSYLQVLLVFDLTWTYKRSIIISVCHFG